MIWLPPFLRFPEQVLAYATLVMGLELSVGVSAPLRLRAGRELEGHGEVLVLPALRSYLGRQDHLSWVSRNAHALFHLRAL